MTEAISSAAMSAPRTVPVAKAGVKRCVHVRLLVRRNARPAAPCHNGHDAEGRALGKFAHHFVKARIVQLAAGPVHAIRRVAGR